MGTAKSRIIQKHFRLDAAKLKRAQKLLDATTATETVERALDLAISEHERNRLTAEANQKFVIASRKVDTNSHPGDFDKSRSRTPIR